MFIREKRVNGVIYRSLIESCREGGKVRQRLLYNLGRHRTTLAECIGWERRRLDSMRAHTGTFEAERIESRERLVAQLEGWEQVVVARSPRKRIPKSVA